MANFVSTHLDKLDNLLESARSCVAMLPALRDGKVDAFSSMAEMSFVHGHLKDAVAEARKLSDHFSAQMKRQAKR